MTDYFSYLLLVNLVSGIIHSPQVGNSLSASETDDRFYFALSIYYRISQYVAEANESMDEKREKLQVLKKHHPKPEINYVTIGSYFMVGKKRVCLSIAGFYWCHYRDVVSGKFKTLLK